MCVEIIIKDPVLAKSLQFRTKITASIAAYMKYLQICISVYIDESAICL